MNLTQLFHKDILEGLYLRAGKTVFYLSLFHNKLGHTPCLQWEAL